MRRVSPPRTKAVAGSSVSGMCCATCERRHCAGTEKSPASSCNVPLRSANRVDLPAPLRPTRPTFSPGLMVTDTPSRSTLAPRRKVTFLSWITVPIVSGRRDRLPGQQQYLVLASGRFQPHRLQPRESGLEMRAFVADLQHQHRLGAHSRGCIAQQRTDEVHAV